MLAQDQLMRRIGFIQGDSVMASYLSASRLSALFRVLDVLIIVAMDLLLTLPVGPHKVLAATSVWLGQLTVPRRLLEALAEVFLDAVLVALLMEVILEYFLHSSIEARSCNQHLN